MHALAKYTREMYSWNLFLDREAGLIGPLERDTRLFLELTLDRNMGKAKLILLSFWWSKLWSPRLLSLRLDLISFEPLTSC